MPVNMSHCRMANTLAALREARDDLDGSPDMSAAEESARDSLLLLCADIAADFECEIEEIRLQRKREKAQRVARGTL